MLRYVNTCKVYCRAKQSFSVESVKSSILIPISHPSILRSISHVLLSEHLQSVR